MFLRLSQNSVIRRGPSCLSSLGGSARHLPLILFLAAIFIAARPIPVLAAIIYGDYMGNTVNYKMVQEDANSPPPDAPPLFGKPTILEAVYPALPCTTATCTLPGDTLDFNPVGFSASAAGAAGVDVTDGNLSFMVEAKPGQSIKNIKIKEFGDTTLTGNVPLNSIATSTAVRLPVFIDIVAVNGVGINPIKLNDSSIPPIVATFNPSNGDFYLGVDGAGGPLYHTTWTGELFVNLEAIVKGITKINVNLDNVLVATSEAGTSAIIAKKDFFIITTNIPEPTSCSLVLLALAVGGCVARRARP